MIQIKDENNKIIKWIYNREEIEIKLIEYNSNHYKKVYQSKYYKDKIYHQLTRNDI